MSPIITGGGYHVIYRYPLSLVMYVYTYRFACERRGLPLARFLHCRGGNLGGQRRVGLTKEGTQPLDGDDVLDTLGLVCHHLGQCGGVESFEGDVLTLGKTPEPCADVFLGETISLGDTFIGCLALANVLPDFITQQKLFTVETGWFRLGLVFHLALRFVCS